MSSLLLTFNAGTWTRARAGGRAARDVDASTLSNSALNVLRRVRSARPWPGRSGTSRYCRQSCGRRRVDALWSSGDSPSRSTTFGTAMDELTCGALPPAVRRRPLRRHAAAVLRTPLNQRLVAEYLRTARTSRASHERGLPRGNRLGHGLQCRAAASRQAPVQPRRRQLQHPRPARVVEGAPRSTPMGRSIRHVGASEQARVEGEPGQERQQRRVGLRRWQRVEGLELHPSSFRRNPSSVDQRGRSW